MVSESWRSMRVTVKYFEGYPELEAELAKHSPRARAERLRFLAAMGLAFISNGRPLAGEATAAVPAATPEATTPITGKSGSSTAKAITRQVFRQAEDD